MKLAGRLTFGYAVVVIVMIVMITISFSILASLNKEVDTLVNDRFPKTVWANTIIDRINENARCIRNILLTSDPVEIKSNYDRMANNSAVATIALDSLKATIRSDEGKKLLSELENKRSAYFKVRDEMFDVMKKNRYDLAEAMVFTTLREVRIITFMLCKPLLNIKTSLFTNLERMQPKHILPVNY
jgi:methyl-accepting chemotaxis protein